MSPFSFNIILEVGSSLGTNSINPDGARDVSHLITSSKGIFLAKVR